MDNNTTDSNAVVPKELDPDTPAVDETATVTDTKPQAVSRFKELESPLPLLNHPLSVPIPTVAEPPQDEQPKEPKDGDEPPEVSLEDAIAQGSSLFGGGARDAVNKPKSLFELRDCRSALAGFSKTSYIMDGDDFRAILETNGPSEEVAMEYETLWLDLQIFWDAMLRQLPNRIMDSREHLRDAADLVADMAVGRTVAELRCDCTPDIAARQIKELRRRLQRLQLMLLDDLQSGSRIPKVHCGCVVPIKRIRDKARLWTPLFASSSLPSASSSSSSSSGSGANARLDDRNFTFRDVACLLRLEDYLTFVSLQIQQRMMGREPDENNIVATAQSFMDDAVRAFLPGVAGAVAELRMNWAEALRQEGFRAALADEVERIGADAVEFGKKSGRHRDYCEARTQPKPFLKRSFGFR